MRQDREPHGAFLDIHDARGRIALSEDPRVRPVLDALSPHAGPLDCRGGCNRCCALRGSHWLSPVCRIGPAGRRLPEAIAAAALSLTRTSCRRKSPGRRRRYPQPPHQVTAGPPKGVRVRPSCREGQSRNTTDRRELLIFNPPSYSMNPSFRNLFMKTLTCDRVVPTISAKVS